MVPPYEERMKRMNPINRYEVTGPMNSSFFRLYEEKMIAAGMKQSDAYNIWKEYGA